MESKEREIMREHIVWLGKELEDQRKLVQQHMVFCKRLLDPEDLGHAVSHEVRQLAYVLMINKDSE
jgi:hypothetical protein